MDKRNRKIILIMSVALLLISISGVAYAYFSAQVTGGEDSTTLNVTGGTLGLTVAGGNSITISNTFPQSNAVATKTITVTGNNTTELTMPYTLNLVIDSNTFGTGSITYTLTSTNTDNTGTIISSIGTQTGIATGASTISLGSGSFDGNTSNKVHTYVLTIYYPDTGSSQNSEQGSLLNAHVTVSSGEADLADAPTGWYTSANGTLLKAIKTNNTVSATLTSPGKTVSTSGEAVLASTTDDYGTSYYYRGAVVNNYVVFANMCWRIVRVTGDGSIKLVLYNYNSTDCTSTSDTTAAYARYSGTTYTSQFNDSMYYNAVIGFMYGTASASTYALEHANTNSSVIKTNLETWYTSKLASYSSHLADTIWCNDKSLYSGLGYGSSMTYTFYSGSNRLGTLETANPSLVCPNDANGGKLSKYTADDTTNGNGDLTYKIGLLTADEVAFAGGAWLTSNSTYYLYNNAVSFWWTMTPNYSDGGNHLESFISNGSGYSLGSNATNNTIGLRPAISLVSSTTVTGTGTSSDPYVVQ